MNTLSWTGQGLDDDELAILSTVRWNIGNAIPVCSHSTGRLAPLWLTGAVPMSKSNQADTGVTRTWIKWLLRTNAAHC